KGRYRLMTDYMDKVGTHGKQMMYRTCTVQVNLDFGSELDMVKKMRVALALQPVATALFANSPFFDGKINGHKSWRSRIWRDLDEDRTGTLPFFFEDGMGFQRYVDYALDVPMYFVYRNGHYINALGQSFRDFLNGNLPALPGELPTMSDWADHLTTCFPEARIKKFMEMRGADGGTWSRICALPAFWVGLMYDNNSLDAAWDICKSWDLDTREDMRIKASVDGLNARVGNIKMLDLASSVLSISNAGLKSRSHIGKGGYNETHFLSALKESIDTGKAPADELLDKFNGDWNGDLTRIYSDFSY
ncbi:glutamate-cysteine ligase family protein, partial [Amylibacter sp.]|nr:glutamate-cysteine ligase family protein [Amylibacter sp.]